MTTATAKCTPIGLMQIPGALKDFESELRMHAERRVQMCGRRGQHDLCDDATKNQRLEPRPRVYVPLFLGNLTKLRFFKDKSP